MNTKKLSSKANNSHKQHKRDIKAATINLRNKRKVKRTAWEGIASNAGLHA